MKLSEGVVKTIVNGGRVKPPFILQILRFEKIGACFHLTLSDGELYDTLCTLPEILTRMIRSGDVPYNSVIRITDCNATRVLSPSGKFKMVQINCFDIVAHGFPNVERVGRPRLATPREEFLKANQKQLSKGALSAIMKGNRVDSPIMQVLGNKYFPLEKNYGVILSDGLHIYTSYVVLAEELAPKMFDGHLNHFSIICIKDYYNRPVQDAVGETRTVLRILEVEVLVPGDIVAKAIGTPQPLAPESLPASAAEEKVITRYPRSGHKPKLLSKDRFRLACRCGECLGHNKLHSAMQMRELRELEQLKVPWLTVPQGMDWHVPILVVEGSDCRPPRLLEGSWPRLHPWS